jgi:hypothetical protein
VAEQVFEAVGRAAGCGREVLGVQGFEEGAGGGGQRGQGGAGRLPGGLGRVLHGHGAVLSARASAYGTGGRFQ